MENLPLRRLPLCGTHNTRDIGGYPCEGGLVRWRAFVRSDNPMNLTPGDLALLRGYGVRCAVDLRRGDENDRMPSSLYGAQGFAVHHISINEVKGIDVGFDFEGDVPGSMAGMYLRILDENAAAIARVMRAFAAAQGGCLFHCAVGKDRTGVIALLLHKLAGVSDDDAVCDYAVSEIFLREIFEAQRLAFARQNIPDFSLRSVPASARRTLAHLEQEYGGAAGYLRKAGLAESELAALRQKLVQVV